MKSRRNIALTGILAGFMFGLLPSEANAISAGDVVGKMSEDQQYGYLTGAVDMVIFLHSSKGEGERAECIMNWFYRDDTSAKEVIGVFHNYKDKPAIGLLHVLINRHCK